MYSQEIQEVINQLRLLVESINNPWTVWVPFLGVIAALFLGAGGGDWMKSWFKKPKLNIFIKLEPPDCHKIPMTNSQTGEFMCDSYYFRFRVENSGNYQMEEVEAMVIKLYKNINGIYKKVRNFLPLNLVWAHSLGKQITKPKIQPKLFKYLDFGHIVQTRFVSPNLLNRTNIRANIIFILDVEVPPNTGSHLIFPGDYKFKIKFAGNNIAPIEKIYHLEISDRWDNDENIMLRNNISIQEIT